MARYRVKDGAVLPANGALLEGGAFIDLPRPVGEDQAIRHLVEEVDAAGHVIDPPTPDDLERFRAHERVGFLRDRLVVAKAAVDAIHARLDAEEQALAQAVAPATPASSKKSPVPVSAAAAAAPKE